MEKLTPKQQQEVNKTSIERLRLLLAKAGYDLEAIWAADRPALQIMYAEHLLIPPAGAEGGGVKPGGGTSEEELTLRKAELEMRQQELERQKQRDEEDRKIREKELELKSLEIKRQRRRDELDQKRKESLAGQTRFFW